MILPRSHPSPLYLHKSTQHNPKKNTWTTAEAAKKNTSALFLAMPDKPKSAILAVPLLKSVEIVSKRVPPFHPVGITGPLKTHVKPKTLLGTPSKLPAKHLIFRCHPPVEGENPPVVFSIGNTSSMADFPSHVSFLGGLNFT